MEPPLRDLPQLLVINPPAFFNYGDPFAAKFAVLRAWESPLPLPGFLSAHAQSPRALLCSGATRVTAALLDLLPSLRFVVTTSAGLNHIDLPECRRRGMAVANAGEVFSDDVADAASGWRSPCFGGSRPPIGSCGGGSGLRRGTSL